MIGRALDSEAQSDSRPCFGLLSRRAGDVEAAWGGSFEQEPIVGNCVLGVPNPYLASQQAVMRRE